MQEQSTSFTKSFAKVHVHCIQFNAHSTSNKKAHATYITTNVTPKLISCCRSYLEDSFTNKTSAYCSKNNNNYT